MKGISVGAFIVVMFSTDTFVEGFHSSAPHWNGLKVRFNVFKDVPRTEAEAIADGFTQMTDCKTDKFRGKMFMKDNDTAVMPLFDVNGYIAGLQIAVPAGLASGYPHQGIRPPFIEDGNYIKATAYFVNPAIICKSGRSKQQFELQGTGTDLYFQNGMDPEIDFLEVSKLRNETDWDEGLCFPKMGLHYFKDISLDMSCDTFFPAALLYYNGHLHGFVWSLGLIQNSTYIAYEYPEPEFFLELMKEVPTCLETLRRTVLHVYFIESDAIDALTCEATTPPLGDCTAGSKARAVNIWMTSVVLVFVVATATLDV